MPIYNIGKEVEIKQLLINPALAWIYMFLFSLLLKIGGGLSSIYYFLTIQNYLTNNANKAKLDPFYSGMKNPFCGSTVDCAAPDDVPIYLGSSSTSHGQF